jgi:ribosomal-protein-alanine N-acetyltransferase
VGPLFLRQPTAFTSVGECVQLRSPSRSDWPSWSAVRTESRDFLKPWEPTWASDALTYRAFRRRIARYAADWREDEGYSFFIWRNSDEQLVGGIGLTYVRRGVSETASVGYWLGKSFTGRGYMTEALRLAASFAFGPQQLHRLEAACLPTNAPSIRLLERVGFRSEGYAKAYLRIDGQWQDHRLYGLLAEEWRSQSYKTEARLGEFTANARAGSAVE